MSQLQTMKLKAQPEFDIMFFLTLFGSKRMEHDLLEKIEVKWNDWKGKLNAYKIAPDKNRNTKGFLMLFLDKDVDAEVDQIWRDSPADGFAFHTLAITLVMSTAQQFIPEMQAGGCAPLPTPSKALKRALKRLDLEWNDQGHVDRAYAVLTPMPHSGGCDACYLKDSCPKNNGLGSGTVQLGG